MSDYKYIIDVRELEPPIGKTYYHVASVSHLYCDSVKIKHDFREKWGRTKEEAEKKMEEEIKEWIKSQN